MQTEEDLRDISQFIATYSVCLLGSGVHSSRVKRNARRIGDSQEVEVQMMTFQRSVVLTVSGKRHRRSYTEVVDIPHLPISFELNSALSALSWEAYDCRLPMSELWGRYRQIVTRPPMNPHLVLLLVGLANAAFCRLFGGAWAAVGIVLVATLAGFFVRQQLQRRGVNHFFVSIVSAFVASACASLSLLLNTTYEVAIATSVLYLIPGVPLINGVIDIIEGHTLTGASRLIQAFLLIICIAVGLSISLVLFKNGLI
jgi:uncharacterized membrane protein YjjP (DUF1212 family)